MKTLKTKFEDIKASQRGSLDSLQLTFMRSILMKYFKSTEVEFGQSMMTCGEK